MFLTFMFLPFAIKTFVLSRFEWPLKTGFNVSGFKICYHIDIKNAC